MAGLRTSALRWVVSRAACRCWQPAPGLSAQNLTRTEECPISVEPRINDRIRVPEVRLVGPNGEQVGIVRIEDALRLAAESDLDLVEVAPNGKPPVCKLMDYGKFKYESAVKAREDRKKQVNTVIKEMKLRPKIDPHDYETKKGHVVRFLKQGDKVKITIMFRGREQSRPELGYRLLQRLAEEIAEFGVVESAPKQDGRNMIMVVAPTKRKSDARAERASANPPAQTGAARPQPGRSTSAGPVTTDSMVSAKSRGPAVEQTVKAGGKPESKSRPDPAEGETAGRKPAAPARRPEVAPAALDDGSAAQPTALISGSSSNAATPSSAHTPMSANTRGEASPARTATPARPPTQPSSSQRPTPGTGPSRPTVRPSSGAPRVSGPTPTRPSGPPTRSRAESATRSPDDPNGNTSS